ncbi:MAG: zinc-dependent alcohol dehydrogenase family protein [Rhodospirillaceae bacterium]|jgi:NADPH:quinone reductase-like Zn-dependent oxidoreductase|nr:zinc-dependent alcohol dehydrogenase family protein [Rhodospirillaceae bacterium]MBT3931792.1 zinc-dependent alcohol dehydrogenase family protein [Rhodospirillaceae bacterium]MBT4771722.1 zinc-dependent alcohol dehydrogenase family protein [Rhodospirillaceae bacterium]MBT5357904.1 zinc-dependent alcohol dehydrogenase family protein [Rhodospirillaceae bacterium]MBT5768091.1 zinc-dependent alcohol dehydrogenase family protein [Rhodospirillaceae bacterium]
MGELKKAVQFAQTGHPPDVVEIVDMETDPVGPGDVLLDVEAAAINPPHLLTLAGGYGVQPELPAVPGGEGIGMVVAVGDAVTDVKLGERVMIPLYSGGCWRQQIVVPAERVTVKFPPEGDPIQLSMIMANPPAAWQLLNTVVDLEPGDWVIQNAANSAVGNYLMQLASIYGFHTVNVVRREGLEDQIAEARGDICIVDGPDLGERVKAATNGADIKLAVDAVGGEATQHLADSLAEDGVIVSYGLLSGEPCSLSPKDIIFRNVRLQGMWTSKWLQGRGSTPESRAAVYDELRGYILDGRLSARIDATYPLAQIKEAVTHGMNQRDGKVIILPNA